jgi:hypothetical protein
MSGRDASGKSVPFRCFRGGISNAASPRAGLLEKRGQCDALLAIVFLDQLAVFHDQRFAAGPGAQTPASAQPDCEAFRAAKRLAIQRGFDGVNVPQPKGVIYSRADFVNEYWRPDSTESRLDFQYYEHDLARIEAVIEQSFAFTRAFKERTGFAPRGWATYFVNRPVADRKPFGLYSGGPGISFSFDPFHSNPCEPHWQEFSRQYNELALRGLGAKASPIQTQWLKRGDVSIPRHLARPRFTTPYFAAFLE